MSFNRDAMVPNAETHVPIKVHIPADTDWNGAGRPDIPPPSLWEHSVKVVRKIDGREAIVRVIDLATMQFRAYWPDTNESDSRATWQHCRDFNVAVTFSPKELEKQAARNAYEAEVAKLDAKELAAVSVLVDGDDPIKALGKLEALRALGLIKARPDVAAQAIAEAKPLKK